MKNHINNFFLGVLVSCLFFIFSVVITMVSQILAQCFAVLRFGIFSYILWFAFLAFFMGFIDKFSYDLLIDKFGKKLNVLLIQSGSILTVISIISIILHYYSFYGGRTFYFFAHMTCIIGGVAVSELWRIFKGGEH